MSDIEAEEIVTENEPGGVGRALVVLPTYNEARNLAGIVPLILGADERIDILIVDDRG